jgi:hypothetical protein
MGDGLQIHVNAADIDGVLRTDGTNRNSFSIDQNPCFGIGIRHRPAAIVIAGDNRMVPGNCGKINNNVVALASADGIFAVRWRSCSNRQS